MKILSRTIFLVTLSISLATLASAESPFSFESAPGRLPKDVVPLSYAVAIAPNASTLSISGTESIKLQFLSATAIVQFNSLNEKLNDVRFDGKPVKVVDSNDELQVTTVTLAAPAPIGRHVLSFSYTGNIETQPRGVFAQKYSQSGGREETLLSTQMETTDARRMFPCWDEPAFRAYFQLTVTVPANWAAVSNMPIARRIVRRNVATVSFRPSPKMPSYLVELTAGNIRKIATRSGATSIGVWAVAGHENDGKTALGNARQILVDYNEYFDYPYPLPKLDSIAVPGGFAGAMENWGAISANDRLLLLAPSSSIKDLQTVFSLQAHEMAHQWFGDLVTMGWWDDIWLNESFASWRGAKETDARNPTWKWWEHEDDSKETAMKADARASSHSIEQHVSDELQAAIAFDPEITYLKGQALLRMLEAYLGEGVFRDGIRRYMRAHAYSNATSADLWIALGAGNNKDIAQIAADWTTEPGFPLVTVMATCDPSGRRTIAMTQRRFLLAGLASTVSHWRIPMQIRSGLSGEVQTTLFHENGQSVPAGRCDEPLSVNANAIGFYRTQYDADTLAINTQQFAGSSDGNRIGLLDDQWALVESGAARLGSYLALVSSMNASLNTRAWQQIVGALGIIEYAERGSIGHDDFTAYARSIIKPVADSLGWNSNAEETPDAQELRRSLIRDLGEWGDPATIREARRRFVAFVQNKSTVHPDDQLTLLNIVAQNADVATFEQLRAVAKAAKDDTELERICLALASVRDPKLAAQVVQIAMSDELPPQAGLLRMRMIFRLASEHPQLSWETFTANEMRLVESVGFGAPLVISQFVPGVYWDAVPLEQLDAWVRAHVPAEMSDNVARGMETAGFKLAEKRMLVPAADSYLRSKSPQVRGQPTA